MQHRNGSVEKTYVQMRESIKNVLSVVLFITNTNQN